MRHTLRLAAAGLLAFALATGCGAAPTPASVLPTYRQTPSAAPARPVANTSAAEDAPSRLRYSAIGVNDVPLSPTGLDARGEVAVPPLERAAEVDYLNWSPELAADRRGMRPLVLISHVSGRDAAGRPIPGGFVNLAKAKRGDEVTVTSRTGAEARYRVISVATVRKAVFPPSTYDPTPAPQLVLITCGGQLNRATRSYDSNVIARAEAI